MAEQLNQYELHTVIDQSQDLILSTLHQRINTISVLLTKPEYNLYESGELPPSGDIASNEVNLMLMSIHSLLTKLDEDLKMMIPWVKMIIDPQLDETPETFRVERDALSTFETSLLCVQTYFSFLQKYQDERNALLATKGEHPNLTELYEWVTDLDHCEYQVTRQHIGDILRLYRDLEATVTSVAQHRYDMLHALL